MMRAPCGRWLIPLLAAVCGYLGGCDARRHRATNDGGADGDTDATTTTTGPLRISEIVSDNDGTAIDEEGQTEDWIELANVGDEVIDLSGYVLSDGANAAPLPALTLRPGEALLFFADGEPDEGTRHLPFKVSSGGERIALLSAADGRVVDAVKTPKLAPNEAFARIPDTSSMLVRCRYTTPGRLNGERCGPKPPTDVPATVTFPPFTWPDDPATPPTPPTTPPATPLSIRRAALFPGRFVVVRNTSAETVALGDFSLRLQALGPGDPLPSADAGAGLMWPAGKTTLAGGQEVIVPVEASAESEIAASVEREGALTLFRLSDATAIDRLDFTRWPNGAALKRDGAKTFFCAPADADATSCTPLASRQIGDRLREIATPGDFAALAEGGTELESQSVKFVVDMDAGDTVYFLGNRRWALHYTFIRELIYRQPPLDRCDPVQAAAFVDGWVDFSWREYFRVERRFLLGTLVRWAGSGQATVDFAVGDVITGEQMRRAFFAVMQRLPDARAWSVRPQGDDQIARIRAVEGTLPIVDPGAPFRGRRFQPVVAGVGYGVLRWVPGVDLATAPLGPDVIVVTDEVPNDIALVGGLITEAFETPLSHVAVLSKNRGTPNMALLDAHRDARLLPYFDKLVRIEVTGGGFTIRAATGEEAAAFRESRRPKGDPVSARVDLSVRGVVDLADRGLDDLPAVGAKAAQIGELKRLAASAVGCSAPLRLPTQPFAVPVVHSAEHLQASGAARLLATWRAKPAFAVDPNVRAQGLAEVRAAILAHPVDASLLRTLTDEIRRRFGTGRVRLRSSSNTEDLPAFSGAGLYTSVKAALDDPERDVAMGLKTVWASLWNMRAYDERELARVDHASAVMGVLVHEAFESERANGVAISRNVLDPTYGDAYYFNAQAGEASVTNPAPGVSSEDIVFDSSRGALTYTGHSSLTSDPVLSRAELDELTCAVGAIHRYFRGRIDPDQKNRFFAVDVEWKLVGPERQLLIKQARPYSFGRVEVPADCREF